MFYEYKRGLRQTKEYQAEKSKFKQLTIKLTISSLFQILFAIKNEPHISKNVKEKLRISPQNNRPEEDYFKAIFNKELTLDQIKKVSQADLKDDRFKEILIAVYLFNRIEENKKDFEKARKDFLLATKSGKVIKQVVEVQFLKHKDENVKMISYGEKYLDFYFPDSAYLILTTFWYILNDNNLIEDLKKMSHNYLEEKINKIVDNWLFEIMSSYFRPIMKEVKIDNDNVKNFVKRAGCFQVIIDKIEELKGGNSCISQFKSKY